MGGAIDGSLDRISLLPSPVLCRILFFLPRKEAASTCILSKKWNYLWSSLPVLSFNFDQQRYVEELCSIKREQLTPGEKRKEFMNYVDCSLLKLHGQVATLPMFRLRMALLNFKFASRIDRWIELATNNYIEKLELIIYTGKDDVWYTFPRITLDVGSLKVLNLKGCKLVQPLFDENVNKFLCLEKLHLVNVYLDDNTMLNLISSCPLLEKFSIDNCWGVKNLRISNHPKLTTVDVQRGDGKLDMFERIEVNVLDLTTLNYKGRNMPLLIDAAGCRNLRHLCIKFAQVDDKLFDKLVSSFPFLETLALHNCFKLKRARISSYSLKTLVLLCGGLVEVVIDTPNIGSFLYGGNDLPTLFLINASSVCLAELKLYLKHHLTTLWFLKLREYLGKFSKHSLVSFEFIRSRKTMKCEFHMEQLREISIPPPSDIKHLRLKNMRSSLSYAALVDGLLWSCHPDTLSVKSSSNNFIRFICEKLIQGQEDPTCCYSCPIKCWRHYLKDVKISSIDDSKVAFIDYNVASTESLLRILGQCQDVVFELRWD